MDPKLKALFESSIGPAAPSIPVKKFEPAEAADESGDESSSSVSESPEPQVEQKPRKKRKASGEEIEETYFRKLSKEEEWPNKKAKTTPLVSKEAVNGSNGTSSKAAGAKASGPTQLSDAGTSTSDEETESSGSSSSDDTSETDEALNGDENNEKAAGDDFVPPVHESLAKDTVSASIQQASRTVFLGNVSNEAIMSKQARKELIRHLEFGSESQTEGVKYKIESIRFRSTAYSALELPKKAAFAHKSLMDATTKSTNAYGVYSSEVAARDAVKKLNGTLVLDRHLRVDSVAHPAQTDHRRCVFVGNLGYVNDETNMKENDEHQRAKKSSKPPADIEEGLWRQFGKAGRVESVRVVRDKATRVGKGIAYVQFYDSNGVERALLFDGKKYPPMLPRPLRVTRAKKVSKSSRPKTSEVETRGIYRPKLSSKAKSMAGRAGRLLGVAGASQFRDSAPRGGTVLEGHRATADDAPKLKTQKKRKAGKPTTRSSRRGAKFKAMKGKR